MPSKNTSQNTSKNISKNLSAYIAHLFHTGELNPKLLGPVALSVLAKATTPAAPTNSPSSNQPKHVRLAS